MKQPTLKGTLVEVAEGLAALRCVRLISLTPHPSARDAFLAGVAVKDASCAIDLRAVAESVYQRTGALILFRPQLQTA